MTTSTTASYYLCGLSVRSELDLHLPAGPSTHWDIDVVWGEATDSSEPPDGEVIAFIEIEDDGFEESSTSDEPELEPGWWYQVARIDQGYIVRFRNCGDFVISSDLSHIQVRRDLDGRHELLPILMAGTVGAVVLSLRGSTVLHASAVAVHDHVLAFVAPSGGGKSTLAALLCQHGAHLVTDDVLTVEAGPPRCAGSAKELRLRPAAAALAGTASRETADGRTAFAPETARTDMLPLAAIVLPWPSREASTLEVTELSGAERLIALLEEPRVFGWSDTEILARDLSTLGQLANQVRVLKVTVPWGPPFNPEVVEGLIELAR